MTIRLSTGLRNAITAQRAAVNHIVSASTISYGDGTGTDGNDQILDSGNGLVGFSVHDSITVDGSTSNDGDYEALIVTAAAVDIAADSLTTEAEGDATVLASARGGSISDLFRHGYLNCYTGTQPTDPDAAATGSLVATYSLDHGSFTAGTDTNGLNFDEVSAGVLAKDASETWQTTSVGGTVGWFRFMSNDSLPLSTDTGQIRFDGSVATSGADLNMTPTTQVASTVYTIDTFPITFPAV